jgi:para-nitrobenzyl esterase
MSTYWVNFIATGNPNGKGVPHWPAYTIEQKKIMVFDVEPQAKALPDSAALEFVLRRTSNK